MATKVTATNFSVDLDEFRKTIGLHIRNLNNMDTEQEADLRNVHGKKHASKFSSK